MLCSHCQHDNLRHAKFCGQCGQRLGLPCPHCKTPNVATNNFCSECGAPLGEADETIAGPAHRPKADTPIGVSERKHITVVFSDLTGYTLSLIHISEPTRLQV